MLIVGITSSAKCEWMASAIDEADSHPPDGCRLQTKGSSSRLTRWAAFDAWTQPVPYRIVRRFPGASGNLIEQDGVSEAAEISVCPPPLGSSQAFVGHSMDELALLDGQKLEASDHDSLELPSIFWH